MAASVFSWTPELSTAREITEGPWRAATTPAPTHKPCWEHIPSLQGCEPADPSGGACPLPAVWRVSAHTEPSGAQCGEKRSLTPSELPETPNKGRNTLEGTWVKAAQACTQQPEAEISRLSVPIRLFRAAAGTLGSGAGRLSRTLRAENRAHTRKSSPGTGPGFLDLVR